MKQHIASSNRAHAIVCEQNKMLVDSTSSAISGQLDNIGRNIKRVDQGADILHVLWFCNVAFSLFVSQYDRIMELGRPYINFF